MCDIIFITNFEVIAGYDKILSSLSLLLESVKKRKFPPSVGDAIATSAVPSKDDKLTKSTYGCASSLDSADSSLEEELEEVLIAKRR